MQRKKKRMKLGRGFEIATSHAYGFSCCEVVINVAELRCECPTFICPTFVFLFVSKFLHVFGGFSKVILPHSIPDMCWTQLSVRVLQQQQKIRAASVRLWSDIIMEYFNILSCVSFTYLHCRNRCFRGNVHAPDPVNTRHTFASRK